MRLARPRDAVVHEERVDGTSSATAQDSAARVDVGLLGEQRLDGSEVRWVGERARRREASAVVEEELAGVRLHVE